MVTLVVAGVAGTARAQTPITDNDFRVDLSQGLVLSGSRITGMGGAFTALATGTDGAPFNPASYAAREMWEHKRFAWGVSLGLSFPVFRRYRGIPLPPVVRIDHAFVRGALRAIDARVVSGAGSDHRALAVRIDWDEESERVDRANHTAGRE